MKSLKSSASLKEQIQASHGNFVSLSIKVEIKMTAISFSSEPEKGNESKVIYEDERFKFSEYKNVENAKLTIEKANLTDRGYYSCIGSNDLMKTETRDKGFVRVKDKLAALWPFLGICAEVFVLCAIILIYEKRRNKTDLDESDTDQSPDQ